MFMYRTYNNPHFGSGHKRTNTVHADSFTEALSNEMSGYRNGCTSREWKH
jgi:hypothetical protein